VLGCGLDVVYPPEHRRLTEEVAEAGLLLSEYPPGTPPLGRNFPARNRIISGVALGTVIVEAREASGSLGTARAALEQNREVFAVPGNLTSPLSAGPNFLIKQGAKLVQSWRDVLEEIPGVAGLAEPEPAPRAASGADLPPEQAALLGRIPSDRAVEFDLLAGAPGEVARLTGLLLELELRGLVRQLPGGLYVRTGRRASLGSGSGAPPRIAAKWPPK
jgi:DNA processing protein